MSAVITKAFVAKAPMPQLIALGIKTIETKGGPPAGEMCPAGVRPSPGWGISRGEVVAVVSGMGVWTYDEYPEAWDQLARHHMWTNGGRDLSVQHRRNPTRHVTLGAVVCTVTVDDALPIVGETGDNDDELYRTIDHRNLARQIVTGDGSRPEHVKTQWLDDQLPLGDFEPGRWGWLLSNVQPCDPIPCKGRQGVFTLPDDVAAQLAEPKEN